ncbi:DUF1707 domain-containing protein [Microbacterium sp. ARD31]|uniref:DUF1707 SHOCT-like domain-containing protein n=1 Tax=Microbacterium sp. ARD31 TaxID=2962576 RepID=UPI002882863E|nr:DUF1707 domain-containing protein [Microbacterium sp. ARD31]MDT0183591.1 DUF1707 domain-containing protein [Microbacterium sp. ARD31]
MSQQQPEESARLDAFVQRQVADAVRRKEARAAADAELRASTLASDTDRDLAAGVLNQAFAEGRLTAEEHAERTTGAFTARTHGDLDRVLAGLHVPAPQATETHAARRVLFWMVTVMTSPFLLMGLGLLLAGSDNGGRVFGLVLIVLFAPGLFALNRWAWPKADGTRWPRMR